MFIRPSANACANTGFVLAHLCGFCGSHATPSHALYDPPWPGVAYSIHELSLDCLNATAFVIDAGGLINHR